MDKDRIEVGPPIQALAHALQDCFNEAVKQGTAYVDERLEHFGGRLDKQDATLRLIWKQVKGNGKLPIDA